MLLNVGFWTLVIVYNCLEQFLTVLTVCNSYDNTSIQYKLLINNYQYC